ncbi:MAG: 50S ribosomal protein L30 [Acidobacteria bacterium]|nr:50S ribosomal protein L30 [Acidobacteriota bacterium]
MSAAKKATGTGSTKGTIKIRWVMSAIACPQKHKLIVRGLGLRKLQQVVVKPDNAGIRGMVAKIPHLVKIID